MPRVNGADSCSAETNTLRRTEWHAQSLVRQDVSERPRSFCFHGSGADGRARRRKTEKQAVCARLWRADACAQGVRAQRAGATPLPEGGAKARSSASARREVALWLTSSATTACVSADQMRASGRQCAGAQLLSSSGQM